MYNTPILFLIFNRPDTTLKVFEKIREMKPSQLFIAADGPRRGNVVDQINCKITREIATKVDWLCEVKTNFREENLGCGKGVSESITWFFENVEEGIILEDDCLPNASFFNFCQEMLIKYRNNEKVFHVCGSNFQFGKWRGDGDYYFSKLTHIWGWATWRRAWNKYDFFIDGEDALTSTAYPKKKDSFIRQVWIKNFRDFREYNIDTWDYQWLLTCWRCDGISIIPNKNLILNIGFGHDATHSTFLPSFYKKIKQSQYNRKIKHPAIIRIDYQADSYEQKIRVGKKPSLKRFIINTLSLFKRTLLN